LILRPSAHGYKVCADIATLLLIPGCYEKEGAARVFGESGELLMPLEGSPEWIKTPNFIIIVSAARAITRTRTKRAPLAAIFFVS
jgi:hypothetical protein